MENCVVYEVTMPPSDTISALEFSPAPRNFLCAASWDKSARIWQVETNGTTTPKSSCSLAAPIMDVSWSDDGRQIFLCTSGNEVHQWDLQSNQFIQVGVHDAGVRSCHWIKATNYSCLMTASWDKSVKFWDKRSPTPILTLNLPDRCYAADVVYPMAVIASASRSIITYDLDKLPTDCKIVESSLKQQIRCISIFRDKKAVPAGFAIGGIEGRICVHYVNAAKEYYTFRCHSSRCALGYQNIYPVNDVKFNPVHNNLVTAGSDGVYMFWDTHMRQQLFVSSTKDQSITKCCFNADGHIFAYALGYDWSRGHEYFDPNKKPQIFLHPCFDQMKSI